MKWAQKPFGALLILRPRDPQFIAARRRRALLNVVACFKCIRVGDREI